MHIDCEISQFTVFTTTYVSVVKPLTYHHWAVSHPQIVDFIHHICVVSLHNPCIIKMFVLVLEPYPNKLFVTFFCITDVIAQFQ